LFKAAKCCVFSFHQFNTNQGVDLSMDVEVAYAFYSRRQPPREISKLVYK
jgi:hypothetical protein